jgi:hypothetical protein
MIPPWLGLLPLLFFAAHAGFHAAHGRPHEILWTCTMANLVLGAGLLWRRPGVVATAVSWLVLGNLLWAVDLLSGGEFYATSLLTHVAGLGVGWLGVRRLGWPAGTWWRAVAALAALQQLTRLLTPARANVNLAFSVYAGSAAWFPSYGLYWASLLLLSAAVFLAVERGLGRK